MACANRNCNGGTPICNANNICCIQFMQDCGEGCTDLLDGFSRIQITVTGGLEICSNVGGVCDCFVLDDTSDSFVDNGDGTFTHTAVDGVVQDLDICANLAFCDLEDMGNVLDGGTQGQILVLDESFPGQPTWIPTTVILPTQVDTLTNNGDGTFTHDSIDGTDVTINVCQMLVDGNCTDSFANNGDGSITHIDVQNNNVTIDICSDILPNCFVENMGNVAPGAGNDNIFVHQAGTWIPTPICQALDDANCTDVLTDNGDETFTHTSINGTPVTINICSKLQFCEIGNIGNVIDTSAGIAGHIFVSNGVGDWVSQAAILPTQVDTLTNNGDGTFTHDSIDGTGVTINVCQMLVDGNCVDTWADIGGGTMRHTSVDNTIVDINVCDLLCDDNCFGQNTVSATALLATQPGAWLTPVDQVLSGPICTVLNNTSDSEMVYSVNMTGTQMIAGVMAVALGDVVMTHELSTDGGGTWTGTASNNTRLQPDNMGSMSEQATSAGYNFDITIPAGGSQTVCTRMVARIGPTGIAPDLNIFTDELQINASGRALPVNC